VDAGDVHGFGWRLVNSATASIETTVRSDGAQSLATYIPVPDRHAAWYLTLPTAPGRFTSPRWRAHEHSLGVAVFYTPSWSPTQASDYLLDLRPAPCLMHCATASTIRVGTALQTRRVGSCSGPDLHAATAPQNGTVYALSTTKGVIGAADQR